MNTEEYTELKNECNKMEQRIGDIEDNHLPHLFGLIMNVYDKVKDLKYYIGGGFGVLAIVITLCQLLGWY